ncbi:hypothetical protein, partial [Thauera humireducens]|uniref:hypothetical protein n=1 Tax=Thauera humireducens TaxID=1134435 RepID=UPI00311E1DEC
RLPAAAAGYLRYEGWRVGAVRGLRPSFAPAQTRFGVERRELQIRVLQCFPEHMRQHRREADDLVAQGAESTIGMKVGFDAGHVEWMVHPAHGDPSEPGGAWRCCIRVLSKRVEKNSGERFSCKVAADIAAGTGTSRNSISAVSATDEGQTVKRFWAS